MPPSEAMVSPLMSVIFILAIVVFLYSPKKLRTLGRMMLAFVSTALLIMIPAALVRRGDPHMWGEMAAQIGILIALAAGWWHVRRLKRAAKSDGPPPIQ